MGKLSGKFAIVTGAAKGIGAAAVERFLADDGAGVAIVDMNLEMAQETAKALDPSGERAFAFACNVADPYAVERCFGEIEAKFGRIDILVNSAGINRDKTMIKMTEEEWQAVIDVDLSSLFYCSKVVAKGMIERQYGKIVNISSTGFRGAHGMCNYGAAKYGVLGLTRGFAKELAQYNITINAVCPAAVATDMIKSVRPELLAKKMQEFPRKRPAEPSEVAAVISFLSSDDSSFVNGEKIMVCDARMTN